MFILLLDKDDENVEEFLKDKINNQSTESKDGDEEDFFETQIAPQIEEDVLSEIWDDVGVDLDEADLDEGEKSSDDVSVDLDEGEKSLDDVGMDLDEANLDDGEESSDEDDEIEDCSDENAESEDSSDEDTSVQTEVKIVENGDESKIEPEKKGKLIEIILEDDNVRVVL